MVVTCVYNAALQDLFEELDTDASGAVSLEELTEGLTRQGYQLSSSETEQLVCEGSP